MSSYNTIQDLTLWNFLLQTSRMILDCAEEMTSPRLMRCHALLPWLPEAVRSDDPKVKVIYVARNPKDVAVSAFNYAKTFPFLPSFPSWDIHFEEFLAGRGEQIMTIKGPRGSRWPQMHVDLC